mmetsp:Transcript_38819/g.95975  ORF Transcript_38819/g.95975 Transcript_38819/m.95975 type:complete len:249 (-) Transcript_38819:313-1059(-)
MPSGIKFWPKYTSSFFKRKFRRICGTSGSAKPVSWLIPGILQREQLLTTANSVAPMRTRFQRSSSKGSSRCTMMLGRKRSIGTACPPRAMMAALRRRSEAVEASRIGNPSPNETCGSAPSARSAHSGVNSASTGRLKSGPVQQSRTESASCAESQRAASSPASSASTESSQMPIWMRGICLALLLSTRTTSSAGGAKGESPHRWRHRGSMRERKRSTMSSTEHSALTSMSAMGARCRCVTKRGCGPGR